MTRRGLSQSKGVPGDGPAAGRGSRGTPYLGLSQGRDSAQQGIYIQGPILGIAYARGSRGEGALASGNMVSPALARPWPVARSTPGLWGSRGGGGCCQPPDDSQCLYVKRGVPGGCKALEVGPPVTHHDGDGISKMAAPQWPQEGRPCWRAGSPDMGEGRGTAWGGLHCSGWLEGQPSLGPIPELGSQ